jgi:outer membrane protein OmpA-like peptidoglycan-associated protein
MKTGRHFMTGANLQATKLAIVLSALGMICLPIHAADATEKEQVRGKMIDHSRVDSAVIGRTTEIQSSQFDALNPSSLTITDRRTMLENTAPVAPAQQSVSVRDHIAGNNFESGRAKLLPAAVAELDKLLASLKDKQDVRIEIVGHTDSQRIAKRLLPVYPNNQALSEDRALSVATYLKTRLNLPATAFTASGKGESQPVATNGTPEGMAKNRRVEIRAWYAETLASAPVAPVRKPVADHCVINPEARGLPFSVTVDGQPVDTDGKVLEADRQRCVDVALEKADIQIKYDPLNVSPALNVWVMPSTAVRNKTVRFGTYTNYAWWIKRSELRIFAKGQNAQEAPVAIVPLTAGQIAEWQAPVNAPSELMYVLRVEDKDGQFDETVMKPLHLLEQGDPLVDAARLKRERLSGWGESSLQLRNIPVRGGAVTINGEKIKQDETVSAMGVSVPVDDNGKFVMRQIVPAGPHSVEVAVKDKDGVGASFRRNLSVADNDWFYVAVADLTVGRDRTSGPAPIVMNDTQHYNNETWIDGRGAFYLKGKIKGEYLLTASADTREQPFKHLFTNFQAKDPNYLLRRIDPNRYYPVYGDDSTITDDAPTQGKFYVKLEKDSSYVMWGNFQTRWTGTELTQYSRGLYGANVVWDSKETTTYGEKNTSVNAFVAEPGTLQSREEFRGTGGSLYYFRNMDITEGSERLWVEIRDKDSGLVVQRTPLTAAQDYEINYLQGRVTLRAPLPSVTDGSTLVQTSAMNGNHVYLISTYEYVPGLTAISGSSVGVRASHWINDHFRLGASLYRQGENAQDQKLKGLDTTLRYKPGTWLKAEYAESDGIGNTALTSMTGGFDFAQNIMANQRATAKRIDVAVDLADISEQRGRLAAYWQNRGEGFSGPGLATIGGEAMTQKGLAATVPVTDTTEVSAKADQKDALSQNIHSVEAAVRHKIDAEWGVSGGVRQDQRSNANRGGIITNASPLLSQNGSRTDVIVRVDYRPLEEGQATPEATEQTAGAATTVASDILQPAPVTSMLPATNAQGNAQVVSDATSAVGVAAARIAGLQYKSWDTYGFVQGTAARSGERRQNNRVGLGGSWQVSDRVRLGAEASAGNGGLGGRLSGNYQVDDRSTVYLSYSMETESQDYNYGGRQGTLTSGTHYRYSDQIGMFGETRWTNGEGPKSLTNAFGVDFAPNDRWTTGVKFETGTLSDPVSGDLKRNAIGLTGSYKEKDLKITSSIEYRTDKTTTLGTPAGSSSCSSTNLISGLCQGGIGGSSNNRQTWLLKNTAQYQLDPAWRLLGKLNLSRSNSSQGAFYDGDYTEAVIGAAHRPVDNDRWNTLFKYTYFYNLPSPGQIDSVTGSAMDYTQKSHVLNIDTTYDLFNWLSVGAKYGMRFSQLRASKTTGDWYGSRADLMVLRADLHFVKEWDAVIEARRLRVKEAEDARSGFLVGVYRHVTQNVKAGVGYNFTDFSDDLTDMSYRSRGWFLNVLATF